MNKITRPLLICLVLSLLLPLSACGKAVATQEAFSFIPQEIQPIEENPFVLPMEISSDLGLHLLEVQKPNMDEITNSDEVINAILGSANQVVDIQSSDLVNSVYLETGNNPVKKSVTNENGYMRALIQRDAVGEDNPDQEDGGNLWGDLYLNVIQEQTLEAGTLEDCVNCALLYKYRISGVNNGQSFGFSNSNISVNIFEDNTGGLQFGSYDEQNHYEYSVGYTNDEYMNVMNLADNEWFYILLAMDEHLGFRFITWQEANPANHAFYAIDLSDIFEPDREMQGQKIWADIAFNSHDNEASLDIESIAVYDFDHFVDTPNNDPVDNPETYTYSDDQGKYELAVQLFEAKDYYNAYTLFNELEGFDTANYLAECERLLSTVQIENPQIAGKVKKALKNLGIPLGRYLYVYQAEELESLDLSASRIDDLAFIRNFPNLKELDLAENGIWDLAPLQALTSLTSLSLAKNNVSDVTPLKDLPDLQVLDLSDNLLEDASALNSLTSLTKLDLSTNDLYSIDGLNNLVNLESADLSYNLISSISALENSPIKELNILNTDINDLNAIANFPELETLYAGFRYIWKGNEGYLLTKKYEMDHHFFDGLSGLEALVGHNKLKKLYLARVVNEESLQFVATLTNLESLSFHQYAGANDPNVLGSLVNLKELALDSASIGFYDVSFLSNLTKLEKLYIGTFCHVEDLSVISGLSNLKELRMYKYGEDLSFLKGLKNLRLLQLIHWDGIEDYSPLLGLENLEYLDLQEMTVNDLSVLSQLENLKFLKMDSAQINNIKDVSRLKNLECFLLRYPLVTGDYLPENFDTQLFAGLDHLKYVSMDAGAQEGYAYELGDPDFIEIMEEPVNTSVEFPEYSYYWISNQDDARRFEDYLGNHNLVLDGSFNSDGESIKLTIPKYVRNLYIFSESDQPIRLELDSVDNKGLQRLVIGFIDVSHDDPDGFGHGNFIIENLDGLSGCTNLKEVYINSSEIGDTSALAGCEKLEIVELNGQDRTASFK
jgi:Leucine-rich repeat (LRR) protein